MKVYMNKEMQKAMNILEKMGTKKPYNMTNNGTYGYMDRSVRRFLEGVLLSSKTPYQVDSADTLIRGAIYAMAFQGVITYNQQRELFHLYQAACKKIMHNVRKAERKGKK